MRVVVDLLIEVILAVNRGRLDVLRWLGHYCGECRWSELASCLSTAAFLGPKPNWFISAILVKGLVSGGFCTV